MRVPVHFIIPRISSDEQTFAVVTAEVSNRLLLDSQHFLTYLSRALTMWVDTTEEGKQAFEETCEDFNVGDLSLWCDCQSLVRQLNANCIFNLHVEVFEEDQATQDWTFDTHLIKS